MKIRWHGMLGTSHSWSQVSNALARAMNGAGHQVFLKSTNGLEHFPDDLKHLLLPGTHSQTNMPEIAFLGPDGQQSVLSQGEFSGDIPDQNRPYDLELAYTVFYQIPRRFFSETGCRCCIWNFETDILPPGWALYHRGVDYILPSSKFSSDIFLKNGVPSSKLVIVPHGVDQKAFNPNIQPFQLHTQKRVKFLHNAIPHARKCHDRVLKAYLEAFTGNDDVCLVMKTKFVQPSKEKPFEVDVRAILEKMLHGRKNPPEIEIVNSYVPDIGSLYTACDAVVSMSASECYWLPGIESLACERIVIAPRHGGQLDFLNDENSLLVSTGEMKAPPNMQYWCISDSAKIGDPNVRHCSELMWRVYRDPIGEKTRIIEAAKKTVDKFTWEAAAKQITDLAEHCISKTTRISKSKRHVLYVVPYNMAGGGEVWVRETIKSLDKNTYEPTIAFPLGITPELFSVFGDLGVNLEDLRDKGSGEALKTFIETGTYDIVHFYNSLQTYGLLLRTIQEGAFKGKLVETVHSELMWPDSMMKVAVRQNVSLIIGISRAICNRLIKQKNKNVRYLSQQIDWDKFCIPKSKAILEELGFPTNMFTVGTIARLSPEKNIPMILSCANSMPEALFIIVGNGPQADILKRMSAGLGNVVFVGRRTDTERFYAAFDVFLLPSNMEGVPLTILEALTSGTPTVASNVGAVSEIITDGNNGFIVKNSNVHNFVASITKLKDINLWKIMSENAINSSKIMRMCGKECNINMLYKTLF